MAAFRAYRYFLRQVVSRGRKLESVQDEIAALSRLEKFVVWRGKGRVLKSLRMLRRSFGRFPWSGKSEFLFFDFCPLCICDSSILFRSPAENSAMRKKLFSRISP